MACVCICVCVEENVSITEASWNVRTYRTANTEIEWRAKTWANCFHFHPDTNQQTPGGRNRVYNFICSAFRSQSSPELNFWALLTQYTLIHQLLIFNQSMLFEHPFTNRVYITNEHQRARTVNSVLATYHPAAESVDRIAFQLCRVSIVKPVKYNLYVVCGLWVCGTALFSVLMSAIDIVPNLRWIIKNYSFIAYPTLAIRSLSSLHQLSFGSYLSCHCVREHLTRFLVVYRCKIDDINFTIKSIILLLYIYTYLYLLPQFSCTLLSLSPCLVHCRFLKM